jgi:membrane fusion protein, multidrug efflux system
VKLPSIRRRLSLAGIAVTVVVAGAAIYFAVPGKISQATGPASKAEQATPAAVAAVVERHVAIWDEFSGRLEAVERVDVRSRVAGAVQTVHFREGALVKQGDLLITIDPAPYAAEVERSEAQVVAAQARVAFTKNELERGRQLWDSRTVSQRELDQRINAHSEAEANVRAAQAALQANRLNLDYTEVRAPVAGRVGKLEITVGNLVAAGPGAPVLTTLVSVDPIYASFNADEEVVMRALKLLGAGAGGHTQVDRIPVELSTVTSNGTPFRGRLQLIDNQVDSRSGTVRVRAVFDNPNGGLMPGQFARLRMGQAKTEPALMVNERAVGTDQDKKFVLVVDAASKAEYREVTLGASVDGLRVVTSGLKSGERIVVNGLQRVRPGALIAPQTANMDLTPVLHAQSAPAASDVVQR